MGIRILRLFIFLFIIVASIWLGGTLGQFVHLPSIGFVIIVSFGLALMKRERTAFTFNASVLFSILVVILSPNLIKATITPVGDVNPAYPGGNPDPWNVGGDLTIGDTGVGSIDVNDGSGIVNVYGRIGDYVGSNGTVTITDPCSSGQIQVTSTLAMRAMQIC